MNIIHISVIAVVASLMSVMLKKNNPDFSVYLGLVCGLIIISYVVGYIGEIFDIIIELANKFNLNIEFFSIILKIVAVSYICEFASTICMDAGESSNAFKVEFAGKIIIIALTIPIIMTLADLILTMI